MALVLKILKNWTTNYGDTLTCQTQSQMTFCSRTNGSDTHLRRYAKKNWNMCMYMLIMMNLYNHARFVLTMN